MRTRTLAFVATVLLGVGLTSPALADTNTTVPTWEAAQQITGDSGSLWKPTFTAGLPLLFSITVVDGKQGDGSRAMSVKATYAQGKRSITMLENYKGTSSALDTEPHITAELVDKPQITLGAPGMRYTVRATVIANCYIVDAGADGSVPEPPAGFRCDRKDVAKYGGTLTVTMRPGSTMTAPGTTFVSIQVTKGVSYRQLIRMVQKLAQVGP